MVAATILDAAGLDRATTLVGTSLWLQHLAPCGQGAAVKRARWGSLKLEGTDLKVILHSSVSLHTVISIHILTDIVTSYTQDPSCTLLFKSLKRDYPDLISIFSLNPEYREKETAMFFFQP